MQIIIDTAAWLRRLAQQLGPYLMLEILLPGGTLLALMLFVYRRAVRRYRSCGSPGYLVLAGAGDATTLTDTLVEAAPKNVAPCSSCHWKL